MPVLALSAELGKAEVNPFASFGQPLRGNPNLLVNYPFRSSANLAGLFVFGHLAWSLLGMSLFLGALGISERGRDFGAVSFGLSGYVLSASTSLNALSTIAWIPWLFAAALSCRRSVRGLALFVPVAVVFMTTGEPVLMGAALAGSIALAGPRPGALGRALLGVVLAVAITLPLTLATWHRARESMRVVIGYDYDWAMSASLHPARLLEWIAPFIFGDPLAIGPGSWWGYRLTYGTAPYVYTIAVSLVTFLFALCASGRHSRVRVPVWWGVAALTAAIAAFRYVPGASLLWGAWPGLHALRFPVRAYVFVTFALAVLAAAGFDTLFESDSIPDRCRRVLRRGAMAGGVLLSLAWLAYGAPATILRALVRFWWDPQYALPPGLALQPVVAHIAIRCLFAGSVLIVICLQCLRRRDGFGANLVIALTAIDLLWVASSLFPSIPASAYSRSSAFVQAAAALDGRVYERATKDLNSVMYGVFGTYTENSVTEVGLLQARQGWSLAGARFGLRYAFDRSPDGSYTARDYRAAVSTDALPWPARVEVLRAEGVAGVITGSDLSSVDALTLVFAEPAGSSGVPARLYAIRDRLAEVRWLPEVAWVQSEEAALRVTAAGLDAGNMAVLEGAPVSFPPARGTVTVMSDTPDRIRVRAVSSGMGVVLVCRSYSTRARARVDGNPVRLYPAYGNLMAVIVPSGEANIEIGYE